ncbi:hypothetical protein J437_LFUL004351 [Ladona fulva]|uniref:Uncharacterized protein n=1 Tax=Ladona fulva TaxID=123851 RepID=A0A8K0K4J9_LADFU|nr:hypothetical protein J437_LFUL004351 [Ladona fulva]
MIEFIHNTSIAILAKLCWRCSIIKFRAVSLNIFFVNKCLKLGVFPKFVDMKTKKMSPVALQTAKITWLKLELNMWWCSQRDSLSQYLAVLWGELVLKLHFVEWSLLDVSVHEEVSDFAFIKFKKLSKKLEDLCAAQHPTSPQKNTTLHNFQTRVVNLSKIVLPPLVLNVLSYGLQFSPPTPVTLSDIKNLAADCEVALKNENTTTKSIFANAICKYSYEDPTDSFKVPLIRKFLSVDNLVVVKVDKGKCTVVLDRDVYHSKCLGFIKENNVVELPKYPTPTYQKTLKETLNSIKSVLSSRKNFIMYL